jgi:hypothetical protein
VWLGDIPLPWTLPQRRYRRLHAILYQHQPRGVPKVRRHVQRWEICES